MIKFKKIFILLNLFLFFFGCGYTPIFSNKKVNFSIENIEFVGDGDRGVETKIAQVLSNYKNKADNEKKISLIITNSQETIVASKNSKGEALTNKIIIYTKVKIILAKNNFFEKSFNKSSTYSVVNRKSEEKLIKNKLIENLSNEIAQQIIFTILEKTR